MACYLGGFSVPLIIVGVIADVVGLTWALAVLTMAAVAAALWVGLVGIRALRGLRPVEATVTP